MWYACIVPIATQPIFSSLFYSSIKRIHRRRFIFTNGYLLFIIYIYIYTIEFNLRVDHGLHELVRDILATGLYCSRFCE